MLAGLVESTYFGFRREGQVVEPVEQLVLLTVSEVKILRGMRVGVDQPGPDRLAVSSPWSRKRRVPLRDSPGHKDLASLQLDDLRVLSAPSMRLQALVDIGSRRHRLVEKCDDSVLVYAEEGVLEVFDFGQRERVDQRAVEHSLREVGCANTAKWGGLGNAAMIRRSVGTALARCA